MSFFNAQHGQNPQNAQNAQNAQEGGEAHVGGRASPLLSTALARARDGIIRSEFVTGVAGTVPDLSAGERLGRLSPAFRGAVLTAEALSDLEFSDDAGGKARASQATLSVRLAGEAVAYGPLVRLSRPSDADFARDLELVANYADLRTERLPEIIVQSSDLLSFFGTIEYLHAIRSEATLALLGLALDLVTATAQTMKLSLACPRPMVFAPELQPPIQTPEHASFPSGHATQAFVVATVLTELSLGSSAAIEADSQLFRMASRIAVNRTVAGMHFPSDSAAGALLGLTLGRYLAARARGEGGLSGYHFKGGAYHDGGTTRDFHYAEFHAMTRAEDPAVEALDALDPRPAPLLSWLWGKAREEHDRRWT